MNPFNFLHVEGNLMGEEHARPEVGTHYCVVPSDTDYGMHQQIPSASFLTKFLRICRKLSLPTYLHPKCKYYYPRRASIVREWCRVAATNNPCLVHPFSRLSLLRTVTMLIIWFYLYLVRPFRIAFTTKLEPLTILNVAYAIGISVVLSLNIYLNFVTGYAKKGVIVMDFRMICVHYMMTYFIFDCLDALPTEMLYQLAGGSNPTIYFLLLLTHLSLLARLKTFYVYFVHVMYVFHVRAKYSTIAAFILAGALQVHWNTCLVCTWPRIYGYPPTTIDNNYNVALYKVITHFFLSTSAIDENDIIPIILTLFTGFIFRLTVIGYVIEGLMVTGKTETKYESFIIDVKKYMEVEKLSMSIKQRVDLYFRHKYGGKHISERAFEAFMSHHLRNEISLHRCTHLIASLSMCRNLRREEIGELIMDLKPTIFLAGDIIMTTNDDGGDLYLVSYGKTAAYNDTGMEVKHLDDGAVLGVAGLLLGKQRWTYVAIETTEVFIWAKKDVTRILKKYKAVYSELVTVLENRIYEFDTSAKEKTISKYRDNKTTVQMLLRNKKILDRRRNTQLNIKPPYDLEYDPNEVIESNEMFFLPSMTVDPDYDANYYERRNRSRHYDDDSNSFQIK